MAAVPPPGQPTLPPIGSLSTSLPSLPPLPPPAPGTDVCTRSDPRGQVRHNGTAGRLNTTYVSAPPPQRKLTEREAEDKWVWDTMAKNPVAGFLAGSAVGARRAYQAASDYTGLELSGKGKLQAGPIELGTDDKDVLKTDKLSTDKKSLKLGLKVEVCVQPRKGAPETAFTRWIPGPRCIEFGK